MDDYLISCEVYSVLPLENLYRNAEIAKTERSCYFMMKRAIASPGFVELVLGDKEGPNTLYQTFEVFARFDTLDNLLLFKLSHG